MNAILTMADVVNLNALRDRAHRNAVAHGFTDASFDERIALIHSELSEALEDFRDGREPNATYHEGEKPCGIPTELADAVIRLLDLAGAFAIDLDWGVEELSDGAVSDLHDRFDDQTFGTQIARLHWQVARVGFLREALEPDQGLERATSLAVARVLVAIVLVPVLEHDIDLEKAVFEKMAYNETRPHRHGGKKL